MKGILVGLLISLGINASAEEIYIARGVNGHRHSLGMDEIAGRADRSGFNVQLLERHGDFMGVARDIIERHKNGEDISYPIIVVGHSMGGYMAAQFTKMLEREDIPVALAIGVDPGFPRPAVFGSNVGQVISLYVDPSQGPHGHPFRVSRLYDGRPVLNVNVNQEIDEDIDHTNIDDNIKVQKFILGEIRKALRSI